MIYTVTLNPSLDYIVQLDDLQLGALNRTEKETVFPGGKGINVSQVLKAFETSSQALGFVGGFTGDYIETYLHTLGIQTDFIRVDEQTRINIKVKASQETEINAKGPAITAEKYADLQKKIRALTPEDTLILAGSIPASLTSATYEELASVCQENGVRFIVDAEGELLKNVLSHKPFLIKPNHHELGGLFNVKLTTCEEVIPYGKELVKRGAENVIVSLAGEGAVFINQEQVLVSTVPKGVVKGSVGAGDSMVAGFLAIYEQTQSVEEAFRYSVAAGSATAFSTGLCSRVKIESLLPEVRIEKF